MGKLAEEAARYAISAHSRINQLRKYSGQPYDVHLQAVAKMVSAVTEDEVTIAAAWLHDTVEDTPATFEDIEREFGPEVMALVKELTDISRPGDGNRATRKEIDRRHLAGASPRAKTVKLADLIDNCTDICRNDPNFGLVFLGEMESLLEVLPEGDSSLFAKAAETAAGCRKALLSLARQAQVEPCLDDFPEIPGHLLPGQQGVRRFTRAFTAQDIQEPLLSIDAESMGNAESLSRFSPAPAVLGLRKNGAVAGYLLMEDLRNGSWGLFRELDPGQLLDLAAPLSEVIHVLTRFSFCFVTLDGTVVGFLSRADIEKPVVRMWLFGIIITIEMLVVGLIREKWPNDRWVDLLSEGRLEKARQLQSERRRRGLDAEFLDCLQFSDKVQLALKEPRFLKGAGFSSVMAGKRAANDLESLRNDLAHGQSITKHDWAAIARLAQRIEQLYGR